MGLWDLGHAESQLQATAQRLKETGQRLKMVKSRLREIELQLMMVEHHLKTAGEELSPSNGHSDGSNRAVPLFVTERSESDMARR